MTASVKKLLIPLCHGFILLPLAAIAAGSPGIGPLALLLAALCALSAVGWLADLLLPKDWPVWVGILLLMALGVGAGYGFLPQLFGGIVGQAPQSWMAPFLGILAGAAMVWSQLECRRGLAAGLEPYKLGIGLALYIFTYFSYRSTGLYTAQDKSDLAQPIFLYGAIWLVLSLLIINFQFVTKMAATKNQPDVPKPVRTFNTTLILGLVGIILLIAGLGFLRQLFNRFFQWLIGVFSGGSEPMPAAPLPSFQPDDLSGEGFRFPEIEAPEWIDQQFLTINPYSRPGSKLAVINGIVVHYVGNPGTTAQQNHDYFEGLKNQSGSNTVSFSSHFIIGLDGEIIQCIPIDEKSFASNNRNGDTVSIECCHPEADGAFTQETYDSLVRLTAWLCDELDLGTKEVIRHYDVTGKACPLYYVEHEDAWKDFLRDVKRAR